MEKLLISSCLLGNNTKYNGGNNYNAMVELLKSKYELYVICPEVMGGLSTPRNPSEIKFNTDLVFSNKKVDVTYEFHSGANQALQIALDNNIKLALLKEGSPSCGVSKIYDGTFSGIKIDGMGITTRLLKKNGIKCYSENEIGKLLEG